VGQMGVRLERVHGKWCQGCWLCLRHQGQWPQLRTGQTGVYVSRCWGGNRRETMRVDVESLWVEVIGLWVCKYSSSACVNMHVASIDRLSPEPVGVWGVDKGCRGCWGVGYQVGLPKRG